MDDSYNAGMGFLMIAILFALYWVPSFIAFKRNHINRMGVLLVNVFLGWTFIGWLIALLWAIHNKPAAVQS